VRGRAAGDFTLSRQAYLEIIEAKTAELCACCCRLGGHYAGGDAETVRRLTEYGRKLGSAFQIVDDLLDLEGEEQTTGKSLGTDLAHRKMTLPLILLRDQLGKGDLVRLQALYEEPDGDHAGLLRDWLDDSGALAEARRVAESVAASAAAQLQALVATPARGILEDLARFVVAREA
jgi:octaprenyl-diphosphate synthase